MSIPTTFNRNGVRLHGPSHLDIYEENEDENLREMAWVGGRGGGRGREIERMN